MKKLVISLCVLLPNIAFAQTSVDLINVRQQAFVHIENQSEQVEEMMDEDVPNWSEIESISQQLVQHSQLLNTAFPEGSQDGSKAKEAVWDKPEKFNQLMQEMDSGFALLYQASQQQDKEAAEAGLEQAQDTCNGCHRSYRSRF
ncbi:cytochrome c [Aliivibrio fischeri]|uniref:c-type cytochrome n=1 Tax=Aliivibrio fischeri TaxID=668 RepID=UPI0012D9078D|nr:cytochrome c [Aliivibrio fischeri]MCE4936503.1 cytochrome c [Aliivibrio fischeri]MUK29254.1 cytochrome c [Aliivibrio fischeri]